MLLSLRTRGLWRKSGGSITGETQCLGRRLVGNGTYKIKTDPRQEEIKKIIFDVSLPSSEHLHSELVPSLHADLFNWPVKFINVTYSTFS